MKHYVRLFAILLAVICIIPLAACNNNGGKTPIKTEPKTDPATEPGTELPTRPVEIETSNRTDSSVCFTGEFEEDASSVFYDSPEEAIAANPDGVEISYCVDYSADQFPVFPEGKDFVLKFNWHKIGAVPTSGVVYECFKNGDVDFIYYTSYDYLMQQQEDNLHKKVLWFFDDTNGFAPGKYLVTDKNYEEEGLDPDYELTYNCGLENWGLPYVAECDGVTYYSLQEAIDSAKLTQVINIYLIAEYRSDETITVPYNNCRYRIAYNWMYASMNFDHGVTYDDCADPHGYCYYSDLEHLTAVPNLQGTYMWIWTDAEGYKPGKYHMTKNDGSQSEADEDGNLSVFSMGGYTMTWVKDIDQFDHEQYGDLYDVYFPAE